MKYSLPKDKGPNTPFIRQYINPDLLKYIWDFQDRLTRLFPIQVWATTEDDLSNQFRPVLVRDGHIFFNLRLRRIKSTTNSESR